MTREKEKGNHRRKAEPAPTPECRADKTPNTRTAKAKGRHTHPEKVHIQILPSGHPQAAPNHPSAHRQSQRYPRMQLPATYPREQTPNRDKSSTYRNRAGKFTRNIQEPRPQQPHIVPRTEEKKAENLTREGTTAHTTQRQSNHQP